MTNVGHILEFEKWRSSLRFADDKLTGSIWQWYDISKVRYVPQDAVQLLPTFDVIE